MATNIPIQVNVLAELKAQPVSPGTILLCPGIATISDGMGGLYRWDASSVATEDADNYNVVVSNLTATGRWLRVFQRVVPLKTSGGAVHGTLSLNGSAKTFYATGVTDANSQCTINLTMDGTPTGTAIFSEVWFADSQTSGIAANADAAVQSYPILQPASGNGFKQVTHGYYRSNALTLTLGLLYSPFRNVPAGTPVRFKVEGR